MNRGFRRLVIALIVPWAVIWSAVVYLNWKSVNDYTAIEKQYADLVAFDHLHDPRSPPNPDFQATIKSAFEQRDVHDGWVKLGTEIGIGVPLAALIAAGLGLWVRRGFASDPKN